MKPFLELCFLEWIFFCSYHVQPNYYSMRVGFSRLLELLVVKYRKIRRKFHWVAYIMMLMKYFFPDFIYKSICFGYSFELPQLVEAIQVSMHNICIYKEVDKSTVCNLLQECQILSLWAYIIMVCMVSKYGISNENAGEDPEVARGNGVRGQSNIHLTQKFY